MGFAIFYEVMSRFASGHGFSRADRITKWKSVLADTIAAAEAVLLCATVTARLKACPDTKRVVLQSCMAAMTLAFLASSASAQRIQFRDITAQAGIHFAH